MSQESSPERQHRDPMEYFPYLEDWDAIQGGRPRVFFNPNRRSARWIVVHVYEQHTDAEHRFKNGAVVETMPPEPGSGRVEFINLSFDRKDEDGNTLHRNIRIPSIMYMDVHGVPCEERSNASGTGYRRITSQGEYVSYIHSLQANGMEELRYGQVGNGLGYIPEKIHAVRPLEQSS